MYCLCYISTRKHDLDDDILKQILLHSRENNRFRNLTGILVLLKDKFIQILEGDENDVNDIYNKIMKDNRHQYVQKVYSGEIEKRNFKTWAMAFHEIHWDDLEDAGLVKEYDKSISLEQYLKEKDHYIIEFLKSYNGINELQLNLPS
ncbi:MULTISPECIES: BLUF domain-containing protein [Flammeovirga]|uniref:BLUF domain-containing protein n=1 Tax=Flammeovirga agarivorans TaxID=2726742 RepID=A0A7X8SR34_9BACT|nr:MULTISPECIES: BLUF domain-containing protein [Flammeovirga]NLR94702.1 BLUF domain-containing protein [Flammeovirga agarivorans]